MSKPVLVSLKGQSIDVAPALPLTVKDWRELGRRGLNVLSMPRMVREDRLTVDELLMVAHTVIKKVRPEITEADLEEISLPELSSIASTALVAEQEARELDTPTSTASSPSPSTSDGGLPTSSA